LRSLQKASEIVAQSSNACNDADVRRRSLVDEYDDDDDVDDDDDETPDSSSSSINRYSDNIVSTRFS